VLPLIAALALFLQTLFIPLHAASALGAKAAALAELSAAIGVDATLCAAPGDADPARSPPDRNRDCRDTCPLCQFAGQAALIVPEAPSLPHARLTAPIEIGRAVATDAPRFPFAPSAQPRAPPVSA
jgi:hypothetical protein